MYFAALDENDAAVDRGIEAENLILACRRAAGSDSASAVALLRNAWAVLKLTGPFIAIVELGEAVASSLSEDDCRRAIVDRIVGAALYLLGDKSGARGRYESAIRGSAGCGRVAGGRWPAR